MAINRSKSYLGQITGHLLTLLSEALEERQIDHNPAKHLLRPKTKKSSERFLSMTECYRLLAACDGRDHLILSMFLICGLRLGELFAMRVKDVHLEFVDGQSEWRLRIDKHSMRVMREIAPRRKSLTDGQCYQSLLLQKFTHG